jgi:putative transposase
MEDLAFRMIANGFLRKHMIEGGFGQFRRITKYVVNANSTSETCPESGARVMKDLRVRLHHCPDCGYTTDRDVVRSQVIRIRGIGLISTPNTPKLGGTKSLRAGDLAGVGVTQSSPVPKSRQACPEQRRRRISRKQIWGARGADRIAARNFQTVFESPGFDCHFGVSCRSEIF